MIVYGSGRLFKTLMMHCVCSSELSVKCGFLYKRGKYHTTWKRRWFVLKPPYLLYYKSKDDKRPKGYIDLIGATVKLGDGSKVIHVRHCSILCRTTLIDDLSLQNTQDPFSFEIHSQTRVWFLQAGSEHDMHKWVEGILDFNEFSDQ